MALIAESVLRFGAHRDVGVLNINVGLQLSHQVLLRGCRLSDVARIF